MTRRLIDDRDIEAAFLARAAGTPSADLHRRIVDAARSAPRRRPIFGLHMLAWPGPGRLAWAAILAALTLALAGILALTAGWRPSMLSLDPSPSSPPSSAPTFGPSTPRTLQARFVSDDGITVTIDIVDESGRLLEAVKGQDGLITQPTSADVQFTDLPGQPTALHVAWFSPAGCHEHYGMTIHQDLLTITIHTAYVEGGDSIGGNCGVTLRFTGTVVASQLRGVLQNTPPVFGVGSLSLNGVARVVATDGLRVRSAPGLGADSARLEPLLPAGVRLRVVAGPATADGYAWYRVEPCDGQPAYPSGWVAVAGRLGEPWVEPADGAVCVQASRAPLQQLGEIAAPACGGGEVTGADIDRLASPPIGVIEALTQDFAGLLPADEFALASHEGRPAVAVIREGQVVFIGTYDADGHIYQYLVCAASEIKVHGAG